MWHIGSCLSLCLCIASSSALKTSYFQLDPNRCRSPSPPLTDCDPCPRLPPLSCWPSRWRLGRWVARSATFGTTSLGSAPPPPRRRRRRERRGATVGTYGGTSGKRSRRTRCEWGGVDGWCGWEVWTGGVYGKMWQCVSIHCAPHPPHLLPQVLIAELRDDVASFKSASLVGGLREALEAHERQLRDLEQAVRQSQQQQPTAGESVLGRTQG